MNRLSAIPQSLSFAAATLMVCLLGCSGRRPIQPESLRTLEEWAKLDPVAMPPEAEELLERLIEMDATTLNDALRKQRDLLRTIKQYADPSSADPYGSAQFLRDLNKRIFELRSDGSGQMKVVHYFSGAELESEPVHWEIRLDEGWYARYLDLESRSRELFESQLEDGYTLLSSTFNPKLTAIFR